MYSRPLKEWVESQILEEAEKLGNEMVAKQCKKWLLILGVQYNIIICL